MDCTLENILKLRKASFSNPLVCCHGLHDCCLVIKENPELTINELVEKLKQKGKRAIQYYNHNDKMEFS